MTTAPLITIGITCYNAADSITRAIKGALAQDYPNTEIIIIDDCSTDNSLSMIKALQSENPSKINLHTNTTNLGVAGSRNKILDHAKGELIAFFDDDDDNLPNRLTTQYHKIITYEKVTGVEYVLCFSSICKKYPNGYETHTPAIGSQNPVPKEFDLVASNLFLDNRREAFYGGGTPSCSLMARKKTLSDAGGYDPELRRIEDTDLSIRCGINGAHFIGCAEEMVIQYASDGVDKSAKAGLESELHIIKKYRHILDQHGRYNYAKDWIYVRYYHFSGQKPKAILKLLSMMMKYPLLTIKRFIKTAPRRLAHEKRMHA